MGQLQLRDQKTVGTEVLLDRTLRWMQEKPRRREPSGASPRPPERRQAVHKLANGDHRVLLHQRPWKSTEKGQGPRQRAFKFFVTECMTDFMNASSTKVLPAHGALGAGAGDAWLYHVYRCGFVHEFYSKDSAWTRSTSARYWLKYDPVTLNINGLVKGFYKGVEEFKKKAGADPDLRTKFKTYITA